MLLTGKVIVVTGAGRGIGNAIARQFAASGASVVLVGRNADQIAGEAQDVAMSTSAETRPFTCDVSQPTEVKALFNFVFHQFGRLDGLVNNAGVLDDALVGMITPAQIERVFGVNVFGVLTCCQYASRLMRRAGGGSIVNLASIIGVVGNSGQSVYGASKAAVIGLTKSLAKELAADRIRVNAIAPGLIDTDMARSIPPAKFDERLASVQMRRIGRPDEVASVALFLSSDLSTYVTGQVIGVDGGMII
jgi:3-oxoacyl-[acyl-carrier protein] reductase